MNINPTLLEDCRRGDQKAQYLLYKSCFQVLMGVCVRYKKQESEAAATLNAGFLKILNNLDKYKENVPFEAWIKRIMLNTLIDDFRKNRKVKELIEYTDFSEMHYPDKAIDFNEADKQFDAEQLQAYIRMLPPMSQKVFNLCAIDGFTHKEVGNVLGISEGTSKWHLSFARKKLIELMKRELNTTKVV